MFYTTEGTSIKPNKLNAQLMQQLINTLNKIQFMLCIALLHVSAPDAILKEFFFAERNIGPTHQSRYYLARIAMFKMIKF